MKARDRLKIPQQQMKEQDPEVRIGNFNEVPFGYTEEQAVTEAQRCIQCKKPLCVDGCPVRVQIPEFIDLVSQGKFLEAAWKIKETNVLPAVCGRVCPQEEQCQLTCVVGKRFKDPMKAVSIGKLERFVADYERIAGEAKVPEMGAKKGKKVAVVGAGPAGLTVAGDLILKGYDVTVFEAFHKPGGVLVYGIPEFRLPKEIVYKEVAFLEKLGVVFRYNFIIGLTRSIDELLNVDGFDAVFVGTGAGLPRFMRIPGEELIGVYSANEYLTRVNLMRAFDAQGSDTPVLRVKRVAVVGGGNVAMDSARTARRLGATVYLFYRRSEKEMPARNEEIHHAKEEGVDFRILTNPVQIMGDENDRVQSIELIKMKLGEPDSSGRRRPVPMEGSNYSVDVDAVLIAIGNSPNPLIANTTPDIDVQRWGGIIVDPETQRSSKKGVFAGGDIVLGAATVILAMGEGRRAAKSIDDYLATGEW